MIPKKAFYFIRHGQTDWNFRKICQGNTDIPLNENGITEASKAAKSSASLSFDSIWASPLQRALHTAKMIHACNQKLPFVVNADLREREWGSIEGRASMEMYAVEEMEEKDSQYSPPSGVELRKHFIVRIARGVTEALSADGMPLIVSHGRVFLCLCEILNIPLIRQVPNVAIIKCVPDHSGWHVKLI
ncbi:MAG: histidine phosphatase family protein [Chlamydiales bacterium]|nr:histidine phosphatase family protein [Chlamydiia bacterium]MCP5507576.1 histidine phosphatase family protein [Chlamydiales bacterium]